MSQEKNNDQFERLKKQLSNNSNKSNKPPQKKFSFYWIYAVIIFSMLSLLTINNIGDGVQESNWISFKTDLLKNGYVDKIVVVNKSNAQIFIKEDALSEEKFDAVRNNGMSGKLNNGPHYAFDIGGTVDSFEEKLQNAYEEYKIKNEVPIVYRNEKSFWDGIWTWLPFIVLIGIWFFVMRRMSGGSSSGPGGQIFNIGKSKAQLFDRDTQVNTTFENVAGLEGAKEEVQEIVNFLKDPEKYTALGGKIPKGALLVGPPGTGKTLLAKAVAGEAKVPFFSLSGSDFVEMFVGVGASRVRDLFKKAKEKSPAIIFIDEIDAIGRARGKNPMTGANDERENTLNQLLTEMDGFGTNHHVIVLAATNRADVLDKALVRAGRFDRQIYVDLPELNERKEIFAVHLKSIKTEAELDIDFLAKQTPGFSGADIANLCNESALIAARKDKKEVTKQDFLDAVDRIVGGLEKKNKLISKQEREVIAYHEAGHATVSWMLEHAAPLVKVTIVPRGRSLGAAWYLPEERQITTKEQIMDEMCAALGGRAAEEIIFGKVSTGALSDLEKVTRQATAMVAVYGLSDKVGNISYYDSSGQNSSFTKPYSEQTGQMIDDEVRSISKEAYQRALTVLNENKDALTRLAEQLLSKEVIFKEDLERILGARKWITEEKININDTRKEQEEIAAKESTENNTAVSEEKSNEEVESN